MFALLEECRSPRASRSGGRSTVGSILRRGGISPIIRASCRSVIFAFGQRSRRDSIMQHVAGVDDFERAVATYWAACRRQGLVQDSLSWLADNRDRGGRGEAG